EEAALVADQPREGQSGYSAPGARARLHVLLGPLSGDLSVAPAPGGSYASRQRQPGAGAAAARGESEVAEELGVREARERHAPFVVAQGAIAERHLGHEGDPAAQGAGDGHGVAVLDLG